MCPKSIAARVLQTDPLGYMQCLYTNFAGSHTCVLCKPSFLHKFLGNSIEYHLYSFPWQGAIEGEVLMVNGMVLQIGHSPPKALELCRSRARVKQSSKLSSLRAGYGSRPGCGHAGGLGRPRASGHPIDQGSLRRCLSGLLAELALGLRRRSAGLSRHPAVLGRGIQGGHDPPA